MNQIGVIYATKTSHSQRLAAAIGEAIQAKAENVTANPSPFPADLLFIVGGIYAGKSLPELINYVENLDSSQVKKVVLVTSSVSTSKRRQSDTRKVLKEKGIEVIEEITCPGSLLFFKLGRPNATDIKNVAARAKQIAENH